MDRFKIFKHGGYWRIVDMNPLVKNCFEDKNSAEKVCDGLNEMFNSNKPVSESFKDKVHRVVKKLWDDDGVELSFITDDMVSIIELKDTNITEDYITSTIDGVDVLNHPITGSRSMFIIYGVNDDE